MSGSTDVSRTFNIIKDSYFFIKLQLIILSACSTPGRESLLAFLSNLESPCGRLAGSSECGSKRQLRGGPRLFPCFLGINNFFSCRPFSIIPSKEKS
jgi:hypothetical protein